MRRVENSEEKFNGYRPDLRRRRLVVWRPGDELPTVQPDKIELLSELIGGVTGPGFRNYELKAQVGPAVDYVFTETGDGKVCGTLYVDPDGSNIAVISALSYRDQENMWLHKPIMEIPFFTRDKSRKFGYMPVRQHAGGDYRQLVNGSGRELEKTLFDGNGIGKWLNAIAELPNIRQAERNNLTHASFCLTVPDEDPNRVYTFFKESDNQRESLRKELWEIARFNRFLTYSRRILSVAGLEKRKPTWYWQTAAEAYDRILDEAGNGGVMGSFYMRDRVALAGSAWLRLFSGAKQRALKVFGEVNKKAVFVKERDPDDYSFGVPDEKLLPEEFENLWRNMVQTSSDRGTVVKDYLKAESQRLVGQLQNLSGMEEGENGFYIGFQPRLGGRWHNKVMGTNGEQENFTTLGFAARRWHKGKMWVI